MKDDGRARWVSGIAWTSGGAVVQLLCQILGILVLGRLLTPAEFGVVGAALVVISVSELFVVLGVGPALVQRRELRRDHIVAAEQVSLALAVIFCCATLASAPLVADLFGIAGLAPVLRWLSLLFLLQGIATVPTCMLQRELKFGRIAISTAVASVIGYTGVGIVLAALGYGAWALVAAHIARAVTSTVLLYSFSPFLPELRPQWRAAGELFRFGGGYTLGRIFGDLAVQADRLIVARLLGAEALGFYGRAWQVVTVPLSIFGNVVDRVSFPILSRSQGDRAYLDKVFLRGLAGVLALTMPIGVFMSLRAQEIVAVLLGAQWGATVLPFAVLSSVLAARIAAYLCGAVAKAVGAVYSRAARQGIFAVAVLIGASVGQRWGLVGVATGVAVAILVNHLLALEQIVTMLQVSWWKIATVHALAILVTLGAVIPAELTASLGRAHAAGPLAVLLLSGASGAVGSLMVWGALNRGTVRIVIQKAGRRANQHTDAVTAE